MNRLFLLGILLISLSGCYKMPDEDNICTIPMTNNPTVIQQRSASPMPGMGM